MEDINPGVRPEPETAERPPWSPNPARAPAADDTLDDPLEGIKRWIQENQTLAVLGGFALGVFLGAWMRR